MSRLISFYYKISAVSMETTARIRYTDFIKKQGVSSMDLSQMRQELQHYYWAPERIDQVRVFSARCFALLDQNGSVVSTVAAGDPTTWLSTSPSSNEPLTHTVAAALTLPETAGTYQVAFYLKNSAGTGARFANDLQYINGYTVLQTIEIP